MFTRHARFAGLQGLGPRQAVPHWPAAAHANDNPRGHRRPTGQRRSSPPKLVCHWVLTSANRLERRWTIEGLDATGGEDPDGHCLPCNTSGRPPTSLRRRARAAVPG